MIFNTSARYVRVTIIDLVGKNALIFPYLAKVSESSSAAICSETIYNLKVDILMVEPFNLILLLSQTKSVDAHSHFDHAFAALIRVSSSTELS